MSQIPLPSSIVSLFRVFPEVSPVPLHFMESRERCFLPVLVYAGPGPTGLRGTPLLSGKQALTRPLYSDSLPEYTQIRQETTGKKGEEKGPRVAQRGPKGDSGPVNSHTDMSFAHKSEIQMKIMVKNTSSLISDSDTSAYDGSHNQFLCSVT